MRCHLGRFSRNHQLTSVSCQECLARVEPHPTMGNVHVQDMLCFCSQSCHLAVYQSSSVSQIPVWNPSFQGIWRGTNPLSPFCRSVIVWNLTGGLEPAVLGPVSATLPQLLFSSISSLIRSTSFITDSIEFCIFNSVSLMLTHPHFLSTLSIFSLTTTNYEAKTYAFSSISMSSPGSLSPPHGLYT